MSSILKALNRLEEKSASGPLTPLPGGVRYTRPVSAAWRIVFERAAAAVCFAAVFVLLFLSIKSNFYKTLPIIEADKRAAPAISPRTKGILSHGREIIPMEAPEEYSDVPDANALSALKPSEPTMPEILSPSKKTKFETVPPLFSEETKTRAVIQPELSLETVTDPSIILQAISWSADAGQRMAIINAKICREKDSVDGYVIETIQADDVIVSKAGVRGKLTFKLQ